MTDNPSFTSLSGNKDAYPVLAPVSRSYPRLTGRLPTCYSPIRRSFHFSKSEDFEKLRALDLHVLGTPPAFVLSQECRRAGVGCKKSDGRLPSCLLPHDDSASVFILASIQCHSQGSRCRLSSDSRLPESHVGSFVQFSRNIFTLLCARCCQSSSYIVSRCAYSVNRPVFSNRHSPRCVCRRLFERQEISYHATSYSSSR